MGNIVGIIPARGGSVGVPLKNIKNLNGYPLIKYTIQAALDSDSLDRIIVSTNSEKYADIARQYGAEVPFIRPERYSTDTSTDRDFLIHAMEWLKDNEDNVPEYWVHLRPTTPLRIPKIIDDAINIIIDDESSTSLRSGHKAPESPLKWFVKSDKYFKGVVRETSANW